MKLWLITSSWKRGPWDVYASAVVAANYEEEARATHPSGRQNAWKRRYYYVANAEQEFTTLTVGVHSYCDSTEDWAPTPKHVKAVLIGEATPGTRAGVVLASFCAG